MAPRIDPIVWPCWRVRSNPNSLQMALNFVKLVSSKVRDDGTQMIEGKHTPFRTCQCQCAWELPPVSLCLCGGPSIAAWHEGWSAQLELSRISAPVLGGINDIRNGLYWLGIALCFRLNNKRVEHGEMHRERGTQGFYTLCEAVHCTLKIPKSLLLHCFKLLKSPAGHAGQ